MAGSIASALLLLLNMAGALLAPSAPHTHNLPAATDDEGVDFFFFPFLVLYKSGRVERFMGTDTVPASVDPATGVASRDVVIDAAAGFAVRLYLPPNSTAGRDEESKLPLVVFYHGGGFVTESAFSPTYQRYLNELVSKARVVAVSVDYRLSPERRLPTAYNDAWAVLRWALRSARSGAAEAEPWLSRRADLTRLFLVGDSAGGNIAHNIAMRAGREGLDGGATIQGVALLDPYFWGKRPVPSETQDPAERRWRDNTWSFVCAGRYGVDDPVINPVAMARHEWRRLGCARVLVTVAGLDMLAARGRTYVAALGASGWGGEVRLYETPGENHVYFLLKPDGEKAAKEMEAVVAFINGKTRSLESSEQEVSAGYEHFLGTPAKEEENKSTL